jgi:hypothetical protein
MYNTTRENEYLQRELAEIVDSVRVEKEHANASWTALLTKPTILMRVCVSTVFQAMQQPTGIYYFFYW